MLPVPNSPYGLCGRKAALEEVPACFTKTWQDSMLDISNFDMHGCKTNYLGAEGKMCHY